MCVPPFFSFHGLNHPPFHLDRIDLVAANFMTNIRFIAEEPLAANGNHLGFEIHQNSGYNRNNNNRNNGFYAADVESSYSNSNSNIETSDYFDDKYFETRKHR